MNYVVVGSSPVAVKVICAIFTSTKPESRVQSNPEFNLHASNEEEWYH